MADFRIAISGKSGCGNSTVSRIVADRLGIRLINYTFRSMADEQGVSFEQMREMAEEDDRWDIYLDKKQVEMAMEGPCVLGSRLAIWLLEKADLKVFLDAPLEIRARRIQQREGGDWKAVLDKTTERDACDRARYMRLYEIDNDKYDFADMIIDTEKMTAEEIAEAIISKLT